MLPIRKEINKYEYLPPKQLATSSERSEEVSPTLREYADDNLRNEEPGTLSIKFWDLVFVCPDIFKIGGFSSVVHIFMWLPVSRFFELDRDI